ncbi:uncharacterized protein LOC129569872 [Sitodiplosis mosellana]|uniref:uncharacterized protein LOC129569872 n=1 Tax=Sitodiplosis mosellana TaxID=263140 RepID=UPI0024452185|nr:uncharacterized protein LOC129569872 [Sitodiplosis mosellana]
MATQNSPHLNEPPAKARKVDNQPNAVAVAADAAVEEPTPPIFKLINDCCYAIFDWLPRKDLRAFGQTCKWAQRVAVDVCKMKHSAKYYEVWGDSVPETVDIESAQKIRVWGIKLEPYRHIKAYFNQSIKEIYLVNATLSNAKVNCLKKVLYTVEYVKMDDCTINGNFYKKVLKFCSSLKVLCIYGCQLGRSTRHPNGWLTRKYPTLQRLEVIQTFTRKVDELKTFFAQNPNVRSFAIDSVSLGKNLDLFKTTDVKLDVLEIRFDGNKDSLTELRDNLNFLHEFGVFQRLHLYTKRVSDKVVSLNALGKLAVVFWCADDCENISPFLDNITELSIRFNVDGSTMETTARNLVNLERVYLGAPTSEAIVSFIRHSAKLKIIKVAYSFRMSNNTEDGLDLAAWNKLREKLTEARKVTMYVEEDVYLATKWATDKTDYSLIELKRGNSYDWDEDLLYFDFDY